MKNLQINKIILLGFIGSLFLYGCGKNQPILISVHESETETVIGSEVDTDEETELLELQEEKPSFYVYICGAIEKPGVYEIEEETRLYQLIELAGGFLDDASTDSVNQARKMTDGEQIKIPTKEEISNGQVVGEEFNEEEIKTAETLININTALEEELCTINGVGLSRAQSIIVYRETNGDFKVIEDIMKVDGIKEGLFGKMKDQIIAK